ELDVDRTQSKFFVTVRETPVALRRSFITFPELLGHVRVVVHERACCSKYHPYGGREINSTSGGIGFILSPDFSKRVRSVTSYGHRFGTLNALISKDMRVTVLQVCAPTVDSEDEQNDDFHEQLAELMSSHKSSCVVVMGDLDAGIGSRTLGEVFVVSTLQRVAGKPDRD
ncbi:hypothetical protein TELCIR_10275, partial [Teladorsagia circumcincta]